MMTLMKCFVETPFRYPRPCTCHISVIYYIYYVRYAVVVVVVFFPTRSGDFRNRVAFLDVRMASGIMLLFFFLHVPVTSSTWELLVYANKGGHNSNRDPLISPIAF